MKFNSTCLKAAILFLFSFFFSFTNWAQFSPVSVSGFNHDVIAESGTSSLTTTTVSLDGVTVSNKVMYTQTFRTLNAFGGGGIPDNGLIATGTDSYQLAAYNANNALVIPRSQNGDIIINTPSKYATLRVLAFSTEGSSLLNATLFFADGSQTTALTNYSLGDWFNNTGNLVLSGFGRCTRATPASGADAYPDNPRMYYIQIPLSCTDRQKDLQKINFSNVTTAGSNAPYPNTVILGLSAVTYSQLVTPAITNATCAAGGSATLTVTGNTSPYNISWNTVPVQTGITATNLAAGNYIATITDVNSCTSTYPVAITQTNNIILTAHADTTICSGASFNANTISNATGYTWLPAAGVSNPSISNPILSPGATTTYSVTGTLGTCSTSKSFTVTVTAPIVLTVHTDTTICLGASFNANTISNGATYAWLPITGVSDPSIANPVLTPPVTTTYALTAGTGNCTITKSFAVTVVPGITISAGNDITLLEGQSASYREAAAREFIYGHHQQGYPQLISLTLLLSQQ